MTTSVAFDYLKSVWKLYRYGRAIKKTEQRNSVRFLSKAARFYTVGASGLAVNYFASMLFTLGISNLWYIQANVIGIIFSMTTNFILNKIWTFEDKDFGLKKTLLQYAKFVGFSSLGALVQVAMVFYLVEMYSMSYPLALILAVFTGASSNFVLNKKWTFKEKVWS